MATRIESSLQKKKQNSFLPEGNRGGGEREGAGTTASSRQCTAAPGHG